MNIDNTLEERGKQYGEFADHARITQAIKLAMVNSKNWARLADDQREALAMTAHKIGRILNGDPDYADSWHDIIGYIRLVEKRLGEKDPKIAKDQATVKDQIAKEQASMKDQIDAEIRRMKDKLTRPNPADQKMGLSEFLAEALSDGDGSVRIHILGNLDEREA